MLAVVLIAIGYLLWYLGGRAARSARVNDLTDDPYRIAYLRGGASETLEPRIMQVLVALARKQGQVVSRDELIASCWEGRIVGEDALNRCISKVRKLGKAQSAFRLETIPRVGYRLRETGAAAKPDAPPAESPAPPAGLSRRT